MLKMQDISSSSSDHKLALVHEMTAHNFDLIRFASYRTAVKLRFIQKKVSLHVVDIWNIIEAFREQGLHTLEPNQELSVSRLETLLCSLYHSLNKRAPPNQQTHVDICSSLLLNWLLAAYGTVDNVGKVRVFSVKIALATLCSGKLVDKLRYVFSQISDNNGLLVQSKFNEYLEEVLALPAAVYESPTFNYTDSLAFTIFNPNAKITVNDFLDVMMSDPGPSALVWLPLFHRMANADLVVHSVQCDACQKENFIGFRYRCQKCPHYTLCQDCFWRGRTSAPHNLDHQVKEYASFSPSKTIGQSLRKSFRCVPDKPKNSLPKFPDQPEKTLNLSHIVPPSPIPSHNGFPDENFLAHFDGMGSLDSRSTARSLDSARDDEHRLIARYAAKLAQENRPGMGRVPSEACLGMDSTKAQRELIGQLEAKNKEIMKEIARLRRQQELESGNHGTDNPVLMSELRALRMRKDELETHLSTLQDSRRQLMIQLEGLMKMLKNHQASPRSTPNSSPRSTKSPPLPGASETITSQSGPRSAPQTPLGISPAINLTGASNANVLEKLEMSAHLHQHHMAQLQQQHHAQDIHQHVSYNDSKDVGPMLDERSFQNAESLMGVEGDVKSAFGGSAHHSNMVSNGNGTPGSLGRSLKNDLLVAADSVTNAMSTLVRELNSDFEDDGEDESDGGWQQELQRRYAQEANFMAELRARHPSSPPESYRPDYARPSEPGPHQTPYKYYQEQELAYSQHQAASNSNPFGPQVILKQSFPPIHERGNKPPTSRRSSNEIDLRNAEKDQFEEALKQWANR